MFLRLFFGCRIIRKRMGRHVSTKGSSGRAAKALLGRVWWKKELILRRNIVRACLNIVEKGWGDFKVLI